MVRRLSLILLFLSSNVWALSSLTCNYVFEQVPLTTVTLGFAADGTPDSSAQITQIGTPSYTEAVTPDTLTDNEMVNVWFDKDDPSNAIQMIAI